MSKNDFDAFRRLIQYALKEADQLPSPVVGYLLSMANEELDNLVPDGDSPIKQPNAIWDSPGSA